MKHILILTGFLLGQSILAQNLKIKYINYGYTNEKSGFYDNQEIIKLTQEKNKYELEFTQIKKFYIYNDSTKRYSQLSRNTVHTTKKHLKKKYVKNLISELNQNKNNFDNQLIRKSIKSSISRRDIIKLARERDIFYKIGDEKTSKIDELGRKDIKNIEKLKRFNQYLESIKPSDSIVLITSNHASKLVKISYNNQNYFLNLLNPLGQPIDGKKLSININVNSALYQLLPKRITYKKKFDCKLSV
ncbi:hypothetical protein [Chryseobacterium schmidteae]|uniref:hypothetical protein n=1 Tax=Chryseobacterium schmidteae TaxID=2730404 RepID=UPI00158C6950|nr:hypothetical protein [Chryseobacterium schmidteae]